MRRYLVLTDEGRSHPFRRSLPPKRVEPTRNDDTDLKLFALSFSAFFICFFTFLF